MLASFKITKYKRTACSINSKETDFNKPVLKTIYVY